MNYKDLEEEEILCWYDGPLIETARDKDGNVYIAYNNIPDEILSLVSEELLIKMIEHQITVYDCFMAGSKNGNGIEINWIMLKFQNLIQMIY